MNADQTKQELTTEAQRHREDREELCLKPRIVSVFAFLSVLSVALWLITLFCLLRSAFICVHLRQKLLSRLYNPGMSQNTPPDVPTLVRRGHAYSRRGEY